MAPEQKAHSQASLPAKREAPPSLGAKGDARGWTARYGQRGFRQCRLQSVADRKLSEFFTVGSSLACWRLAPLTCGRDERHKTWQMHARLNVAQSSHPFCCEQ